MDRGLSNPAGRVGGRAFLDHALLHATQGGAGQLAQSRQQVLQFMVEIQ